MTRRYVSFTAAVNPETVRQLLQVCLKAPHDGVTELYLLVSTPGGDVAQGITAYHMLKAQPYKVITHNIGQVNSIGNVIFLAGEERLANRNSSFMFHGVGVGVSQADRWDEKTLQEKLDQVQRDNESIGGIITDRTRITTEEARDLFHRGVTKDTGYALDKGIIGEVSDVAIPADNPITFTIY